MSRAWRTTTAGQSVSLPTAALAQISFDIDQWQDVAKAAQGELVNLWCPRELRVRDLPDPSA